MASPIVFLFGPGQTPDNVTALASGAAKVLGQIGTAQFLAHDYWIGPLQFRTGTGAGGTVDFLIATSETPGATGNWTDGIDPTSSADQASKITPQMKQVGSVNVNSGATIYKLSAFGLYNVLGGMPMYWCLIMRNNSGFQLDGTASNFVMHYSQQNYVTAPIVYA